MTSAQPSVPVRDDSTGRSTALPAFATRPVAGLAAALAALLTALSGRYGYHRDELYFLAAGDRPAWGYVDQPPLTPMLARLSTEVFGDTLVGLRVVATLVCVASLVVTALVARELGGGRRAQTLAAACAAGSSIVLATGHMVATATVDLLVWLLVCWLVMRLLRTGDGRWYLAIGAVVGIGLQNKYLVPLLVAGLLVAVLAVGPRRVLRSPWLLAGVAIGFAVAAPTLWWQATHGWPQLTVAAGIGERKAVENRVVFIPLQLAYLSPLFVPIWVAGWLRLWRAPEVRWARAFAVAYPLLVVVTLAAAGKPYYVLPLLIVLTAAGAEPALRWAGTVRRSRLLVAAVAVAAAVNVVATLPVLPPQRVQPFNAMNNEQGEQIGWPTFVATVAEVWQRIPAEQRPRAVIFTANYGQAGAIDRYGAEHGLPPAYSGHMSYADWGPPPDSADGPVLIWHYRTDQRLATHFTGCRPQASLDNGVNLANDEQGAVVELCTGTRAPWSHLWPGLRRYY